MMKTIEVSVTYRYGAKRGFRQIIDTWYAEEGEETDHNLRHNLHMRIQAILDSNDEYQAVHISGDKLYDMVGRGPQG